jgi:CBS domain containing-hemolysin-like protein
MPVLSNEDHKVIGIVTIADLVKLYDSQVEKIMKSRDQNGLGIDVNNSQIEKKKDRDITDKKTD